MKRQDNEKIKSKASKLNFSLKNIIFSFLPLDESIPIVYLHKSFLDAFKQTKKFGIVKNGNLKALSYHCRILKDEYFAYAKKFCLEYFETYDEYKFFIARFLNKKYAKIEDIKISSKLLTDEESAEIISLFLLLNKNIKHITCDYFEIYKKSVILEVLLKRIYKNENFITIKIREEIIDENPKDERLKTELFMLEEILVHFPNLKNLKFQKN